MCRSLTLVTLSILPALFAMDFIFLEVVLDHYRSYTFDRIEEAKCPVACNPFFEVRVWNATYYFGGDVIGYKGKEDLTFGKYLSPTLLNGLVFRGDYAKLVLPKPRVYFTIGTEQGGRRTYGLVNQLAYASTFPRLYAHRREDKWSLGYVSTKNLILYFRYHVYCTEQSKGKRCLYLNSASSHVSPVSSKCALLVYGMLLACFPTMLCTV
ncbi:unnamed protein product [Calicophoron daubneyi]|uniref:Uncharacterized protein n=1 Tax=Calicophoron daubneyi TaxID=300641 RepID=A0AAV2T279_CALDB